MRSRTAVSASPSHAVTRRTRTVWAPTRTSRGPAPGPGSPGHAPSSAASCGRIERVVIGRGSPGSVGKANVPYPSGFENATHLLHSDLFPVLLTLMDWGDKHLADGEPPFVYRHRCGADFKPVLVCEACGEPVRRRDLAVPS